MSESAAVLNNAASNKQPLDPRASVAMWLGALFFMLMILIAVGGFVRLSGSGLSIPEWPIINGSLLPPMSDATWGILQETYVKDYDRLIAMRDEGVVGIGRLVPPPNDLGTFKVMFMIEWTHRAVAAILGIIALGCWIVGRRHTVVTERTGKKLGGIILLIIFQAVLGGILVKTGTSTQWLFVHLATACVILSIIVWSILALIQDKFEPVSDELKAKRKPLKMLLHICAGFMLIQLIFGALVAGSRHNGFASDWPTMFGNLIPSLWVEHKSLMWNLFENPVMHQWVHRWFAWVVTGVFIAVFVVAKRAPVSPRLSLALKVAATFLGLQIILGISNIFYSAESILIALSHLLMAMFLIIALVIAMFDMKYEEMPKSEEATT